MFGKGAIIAVVLFGIIYGIIGVRMGKLQTRAVGNMSYYHDVTNAHNIASGGANLAVSMIYQNPGLRGSLTSQSFTSGNFKGGSFSARLDSISTSRLRLRSTSTYRTFTDTVEVYFRTLQRNSFSMFAWWTNFEGNVFWVTGDTVWGRVHSNGALHVNGRPVFMEKATTSKNFDPKVGVGQNKAVFKQGYETGVAEIPVPTDLTELRNAANSGGKKYGGNIYVTLSPGTAANNDGKAYIRTSLAGAIVDSILLGSPGFNGVLMDTSTTGTIYVKGKLDGQLTIASQNNITILDDVTYEQNPLVGSSDDLLGLVAEKYVTVADNAANNSNCEIHASIYSRTESFGAENYNTRGLSGTLKIVGGIIQDERGAVGQFSGSSLNSGFSKRYYFDPRLSDPNTRPPFFPGYYTQTLQIANWWENVRIPQF
jgi:hypothetical protein